MADRTHGRDSNARNVAHALIAEYPRMEHALMGLVSEVELALDANDLPSAQTALAAMESDFPDEVLTEAARAYFVIVAGEDALWAPAARSSAMAGARETQSNPGGFTLHSAYPNPFNPQTVVPFSLAVTANVRIDVLDLLGRRVATLAEGRFDAGLHQATFDGSGLPSGMYLIRASVGGAGDSGEHTLRITLLK